MNENGQISRWEIQRNMQSAPTFETDFKLQKSEMFDVN